MIVSWRSLRLLRVLEFEHCRQPDFEQRLLWIFDCFLGPDRDRIRLGTVVDDVSSLPAPYFSSYRTRRCLSGLDCPGHYSTGVLVGVRMT